MTEDNESVDTSVNEETQVTDDVELEDMEISFDESDDDETEESETTDDDESANESQEEESEESNADEGSQSRDEEPKEKKPSEEEVRRHNAEMAQRRIAEREAREAEKQKQQEDYLQQAEDAHDMALRQLQIEAYNNRVTTNMNKLEIGLEKAVASIPEISQGSPEVQEAFAASLEDFERMYVKRDQNGDPVEVAGDVYQFLTSRADTIRKLTGVGARQQTKAKKQEKTRTDTIPTRAPKEKKDTDLDDFDRAWDD